MKLLANINIKDHEVYLYFTRGTVSPKSVTKMAGPTSAPDLRKAMCQTITLTSLSMKIMINWKPQRFLLKLATKHRHQMAK